MLLLHIFSGLLHYIYLDYIDYIFLIIIRRLCHESYATPFR